MCLIPFNNDRPRLLVYDSVGRPFYPFCQRFKELIYLYLIHVYSLYFFLSLVLLLFSDFFLQLLDSIFLSSGF